jgi:hypothetical protein
VTVAQPQQRVAKFMVAYELIENGFANVFCENEGSVVR